MSQKWLKNRLPAANDMHRRVTDGLGLQDDSAGPDSRVKIWLKNTFAQPMVWHLNRRSVAGGVAVGLFVSWLPLPLQMVIAATLAAVMRVHVPVSVVMVWFSNPLTFAPLLYAAWRCGSMILGTGELEVPDTLTVKSFMNTAADSWPILLSGALFCAAVSGVAGFGLTLVAWRIHAVRRWRQRKQRRQQKRLDTDRSIRSTT